MSRSTEEEIRITLEESDDDNYGDVDIESDFDGELDHMEVASEVDDEISITESEDDDNSEEFIGKDGTQWSSVPNNIGRTKARNIIRGSLNKVVLAPGQHVDCPSDAFALFITDDIISIIIKCTNLEAKSIIGQKWKKIDQIEMRAFIGMLLEAGLRKQGNTCIEDFWDPLFGSIIFRACMSRDRFVSILRFLRFDDKGTRPNRRERDRFAPIRDVWDKIMINLKKHYIPGANLTVDEQLVPYRGRVSFRQYIPSKPDKYGMKIWWICDSSNSYPLYGMPYLGKQGNSRAQNLASQVVQQLCEQFERSNRNITFDNFFTSYELAQNLLSKGLTCVGTLRKNKACIPPNFLPKKTRELESNIFGFRKNIMIVSYVPKKNRAVLLLSTMHNSNGCNVENKNKSYVNTYYNETKGGVDTLDQMCHAFTVKRKTRRWPLAQFFNIIDVTGIAAFVVFRNLYPDWNKNKDNSARKLFIMETIKDLVTPNIKRRSTKNLHTANTSIISTYLKETQEEESVAAVGPQKAKRRRCFCCPYSKGRSSKQLCSLCSNNVCNEHSQKEIICVKCIKK